MALSNGQSKMNWNRGCDKGNAALLTIKNLLPITMAMIKSLLANNNYAKEINSDWLSNIAEDIYIQETYSDFM